MKKERLAAVPFPPLSCKFENFNGSSKQCALDRNSFTSLLWWCIMVLAYGVAIFIFHRAKWIRGRGSGQKYIFFFPVPLIPFPGGNKMATKVLKICTLNYADSFPCKAWYVVNKASVLNKRSWHTSLSINEIQYIAFKKMTRAALIIQSQYRTYREHERFKKSRRAAAIIQNSFRSYRERRRSSQRRREQRLSKRQEARYIQLASNRLVKWNATELRVHLTPNIFSL